MQVKTFIVDGKAVKVGSSAQSVTWSELVTLRNEGKLISGTKYRITDYETIIDEKEAITAGNRFDIIVEALDEHTLSENAAATHHDGDTYFKNSKVEAWTLKYCLDNDSDRFGWANVNSGKGVIYRMTDEFGNSCPYDFKNILFIADLGYPYSDTKLYWDRFHYTFSQDFWNSNWSPMEDLSLSDVNYVTGNYISDNRYQIYHKESEDEFGQSGFIPATGQGSDMDGSVAWTLYPWTKTEILQLPFIHILGPNASDHYLCANCCALRIAAIPENGVKILAPIRGGNIKSPGIYCSVVEELGSSPQPTH